jgi:hypothetical protein
VLKVKISARYKLKADHPKYINRVVPIATRYALFFDMIAATLKKIKRIIPIGLTIKATKIVTTIIIYRKMG